jgi:hypothetical protein
MNGKTSLVPTQLARRNRHGSKTILETVTSQYPGLSLNPLRPHIFWFFCHYYRLSCLMPYTMFHRFFLSKDYYHVLGDLVSELLPSFACCRLQLKIQDQQGKPVLQNMFASSNLHDTEWSENEPATEFLEIHFLSIP